MSAIQTVPQATSSTLYFGPWYRRSPFFDRTLAAGCSAYDIYNHMYLPGYYADPIEEYWHLLNAVTVWDVSVERIVEITGPDASTFTNMLTCRDLTKCAVGQGKYVLITAEDGGIVNDPVLLRVEENRWWLALADSDAGLWARGVAINSGLDVKVREPEIYPIQVQGPKSKDVMRTLFGDAVLDIKYYWTMTTELDGIPVVISRTGWTGEVGYEIYLRDASRGGDLWDRVMEAGRPHDIRPIAPCEARRIEAGIFNYGSDMTIANNPFEVMGLERLVETQDADYIGKAALEEIRQRGVSRKLVGIEVDGDALSFEIAEKRPALHDGQPVGHPDRPHLVTAAGAQHRLRLGAHRARRPRHAARDPGPRRRSLGGPDGGHPLPRRQEGHPAGLTLCVRLPPEPSMGRRRAIVGRRLAAQPPQPPGQQDGDRGDSDDDRRDGVDLRRHPESDARVDVQRQGRRARAGIEGRDDQVVEREREGEHRAGRDGRQQERQRHVAEGPVGRRAQVPGRLLDVRVEGHCPGTDDDGHVRDAERDVGDGDLGERAIRLEELARRAAAG